MDSRKQSEKQSDYTQNGYTSLVDIRMLDNNQYKIDKIYFKEEKIDHQDLQKSPLKQIQNSLHSNQPKIKNQQKGIINIIQNNLLKTQKKRSNSTVTNSFLNQVSDNFLKQQKSKNYFDVINKQRYKQGLSQVLKDDLSQNNQSRGSSIKSQRLLSDSIVLSYIKNRANKQKTYDAPIVRKYGHIQKNKLKLLDYDPDSKINSSPRSENIFQFNEQKNQKDYQKLFFDSKGFQKIQEKNIDDSKQTEQSFTSNFQTVKNHKQIGLNSMQNLKESRLSLRSSQIKNKVKKVSKIKEQKLQSFGKLEVIFQNNSLEQIKGIEELKEILYTQREIVEELKLENMQQVDLIQQKNEYIQILKDDSFEQTKELKQANNKIKELEYKINSINRDSGVSDAKIKDLEQQLEQRSNFEHLIIQKLEELSEKYTVQNQLSKQIDLLNQELKQENEILNKKIQAFEAEKMNQQKISKLNDKQKRRNKICVSKNNEIDKTQYDYQIDDLKRSINKQELIRYEINMFEQMNFSKLEKFKENQENLKFKQMSAQISNDFTPVKKRNFRNSIRKSNNDDNQGYKKQIQDNQKDNKSLQTNQKSMIKNKELSHSIQNEQLFNSDTSDQQSNISSQKKSRNSSRSFSYKQQAKSKTENRIFKQISQSYNSPLLKNNDNDKIFIQNVKNELIDLQQSLSASKNQKLSSSNSLTQILQRSSRKIQENNEKIKEEQKMQSSPFHNLRENKKIQQDEISNKKLQMNEPIEKPQKIKSILSNGKKERSQSSQGKSKRGVSQSQQPSQTYDRQNTPKKSENIQAEDQKRDHFEIPVFQINKIGSHQLFEENKVTKQKEQKTADENTDNIYLNSCAKTVSEDHVRNQNSANDMIFSEDNKSNQIEQIYIQNNQNESQNNFYSNSAFKRKNTQEEIDDFNKDLLNFQIGSESSKQNLDQKKENKFLLGLSNLLEEESKIIDCSFNQIYQNNENSIADQRDDNIMIMNDQMSYKNESTYEMSEKDNLIFNNQTFSNNYKVTDKRQITKIQVAQEESRNRNEIIVQEQQAQSQRGTADFNKLPQLQEDISMSQNGDIQNHEFLQQKIMDQSLLEVSNDLNLSNNIYYNPNEGLTIDFAQIVRDNRI